MSVGACPRCGAAASGNFCASCGASLAAVACPACGHVPAPGARFCNRCGASLTGGGGPSAGPTPVAATARTDGSLAWWLAGGMLVVLIVVIAWPVINPPSEPTAPATAGAASAGGGAPGTGTPPDLSGISPREAADRLYNRVVAAADTADEATVQMFLPMALQAYEMAAPLDDDGVYHVATLKRAGGDLAGSLATAQEGLADKPDHLLLLAAAAEATEAAGDLARSRSYWSHFLEVYDIQRALGLAEYMDHINVLDASRLHALDVVGR